MTYEFLFKCKFCNQKPMSFAAIYEHMVVELHKTNVRRYTCRTCKKIAALDITGLVEHWRTIHKDKSKNEHAAEVIYQNPSIEFMLEYRRFVNNSIIPVSKNGIRLIEPENGRMTPMIGTPGQCSSGYMPGTPGTPGYGFAHRGGTSDYSDGRRNDYSGGNRGYNNQYTNDCRTPGYPTARTTPGSDYSYPSRPSGRTTPGSEYSHQEMSRKRNNGHYNSMNSAREMENSYQKDQQYPPYSPDISNNYQNRTSSSTRESRFQNDQRYDMEIAQNSSAEKDNKGRQKPTYKSNPGTPILEENDNRNPHTPQAFQRRFNVRGDGVSYRNSTDSTLSGSKSPAFEEDIEDQRIISKQREAQRVNPRSTVKVPPNKSRHACITANVTEVSAPSRKEVEEKRRRELLEKLKEKVARTPSASADPTSPMFNSKVPNQAPSTFGADYQVFSTFQSQFGVSVGDIPPPPPPPPLPNPDHTNEFHNDMKPDIGSLKKEMKKKKIMVRRNGGDIQDEDDEDDDGADDDRSSSISQRNSSSSKRLTKMKRMVENYGDSRSNRGNSTRTNRNSSRSTTRKPPVGKRKRSYSGSSSD